MLGHENLESVIPFSIFPTPVGSLRFGGILMGAGGTGFNWFRVYGMYALVLVLGSGRYRDARGTDLRVGPGDLLVVFPELPHQYGPEAGEVWSEIFVSFEGAAFDEWRAQGLDPAQPVWSLGRVEEWALRFRKVLAMPVRTRAEACAALGVVHGLLSDALATRQSGSEASCDWLDVACQALGRGAGAPSLQEIAGAAGIGYEVFRKNFRKALGESPGQYRKRMRLAQAELMLRRADLSLELIARSLDFCDSFHLSKAFKKLYGVTPAAMRRIGRHVPDREAKTAHLGS